MKPYQRETATLPQKTEPGETGYPSLMNLTIPTPWRSPCSVKEFDSKFCLARSCSAVLILILPFPFYMQAVLMAYIIFRL